MCGLVGVYGESGFQMTKLFHQLLYVDVIRGFDSTGVFYLKDSNKWGIEKQLGTPENVIGTQPYQQKILGKTSAHNMCLMGHNRAATKGAVNAENAHPFRHGNIVLAHNGTLTFPEELFLGREKFDTDSEHIAFHMAKKGHKETWKNIRGAAALSWWDLGNRSLNLIRNIQRPLHYALTEDEKNVIWASEDWMIEHLCERGNIDLKDKVWSINPHFHHKFTFTRKLGKVHIETEQLESYVYKAPVNNNNIHSPWQKTREKIANMMPKKDEVDLELKKLLEMYKPSSQYLWSQKGLSCFFCGMPDLPYNKSVMLDHDTAVCPSCFEDGPMWTNSKQTVVH